jgi:hypothetical protein
MVLLEQPHRRFAADTRSPKPFRSICRAILQKVPFKAVLNHDPQPLSDIHRDKGVSPKPPFALVGLEGRLQFGCGRPFFFASRPFGRGSLLPQTAVVF